MQSEYKLTQLNLAYLFHVMKFQWHVDNSFLPLILASNHTIFYLLCEEISPFHFKDTLEFPPLAHLNWKHLNSLALKPLLSRTYEFPSEFHGWRVIIIYSESPSLAYLNCQHLNYCAFQALLSRTYEFLPKFLGWKVFII